MIGFAIPLNNIYVAFDFGFGSVDGYQRAFRKEFGCNPKEYAANPIPLHLFTPYGVKFRYLERKETTVSVKNVFIQVIDKPIINRKYLSRLLIRTNGINI